MIHRLGIAAALLVLIAAQFPDKNIPPGSPHPGSGRREMTALLFKAIA
ncbi:hypothetical protein [Coleofasciculus sp. FACHB-T130]|nr:hypothetical protein [Coleofasciculus sp. FACHB-T130]MBD1879074.1 hypothetical protein [Coleofasciculus sp. FACHB-T130]